MDDSKTQISSLTSVQESCGAAERNTKISHLKSPQKSNETGDRRKRVSHQEFNDRGEERSNNPPSKSHQESRKKDKVKSNNTPSKSHQESNEKYEAKSNMPPSKSHQESCEKDKVKPNIPPSKSHQEFKTTDDARPSSHPPESQEQNSDKSNEAGTNAVVGQAEGDANDDGQNFSHAELKVFFQKAVGRLIENDPLLSDLHPHVTPEEVNALIELENGQAMRVFVSRGGEEGGGGRGWEVVVPRTATLRQFKNALRKQVARVMSRKGQKKKISWKYVWQNNWLSVEGERLKNDEAKLVDCGVRNKSTLCFVKRYREKHSVVDNG